MTSFLNIELKTLEALAKMYISMHVIDLENNIHHSLNAPPHVEKLMAEKETPSEQMYNVMYHICLPEYRDEMLKFTDLTTVSKRLLGSSSITKEFEGYVSGWCTAQFIPLEFNSEGYPVKVIFTVQHIAAERQRELTIAKELKKALENQNEIFTEMLHIQQSGFIASESIFGKTLIINDAAKELLGIAQLSEDKLSSLASIVRNVNAIHPEDLFIRLRHLLATEGNIQYELKVTHPDGHIGYVLVYSKRISTKSGAVYLISSLTDISSSKKKELYLQHLSETDILTGITNRGYGEKKIRTLLEQKTSGIFGLMDIDKFKLINDNFGHQVGDIVLKSIANALKACFADSYYMRLGGDEFAFFVPGAATPETAKEITSHFFKQIEQIQLKELNNYPISLSLGLYLYSGDRNVKFEEIYQRSDTALYLSKSVPGNYYTIGNN